MLQIGWGFVSMRDANDNPRCFWRVEQDGNGVDLLHVYQSKLTSISPKNRWKAIPIITPEQKQALRMIVVGEAIERPLPKTVQKYFGGRKGFHSLMQDRQQSSEDISRWLGHSSIKTTQQHYIERQRVLSDAIMLDRGQTPGSNEISCSSRDFGSAAGKPPTCCCTRVPARRSLALLCASRRKNESNC